MTYHVRTSVFEGPFDLLLHLIMRHQVDLMKLSLADLVSEYLSSIDEMRDLDLEVTSEFLLIAATLIQLKARNLLPDPGDIDLDDELQLMEERDRLLSRLLACVTFKDVAAVLSHRLTENGRFVPRISGLDQAISVPPPKVDLPVDAMGLASIAGRVRARFVAEPELDHLDLDMPSVESAIEDLQMRIADEAGTTFSYLTEHCNRSAEVVAYFLAILELARWGMIKVSQADWLADIAIELTGNTEADGGLVEIGK